MEQIRGRRHEYAKVSSEGREEGGVPEMVYLSCNAGLLREEPDHWNGGRRGIDGEIRKFKCGSGEDKDSCRDVGCSVS